MGDELSAAEFVPRGAWMAEPLTPQRLAPLRVPVSNVVATWTGTEECHTSDECHVRVLQIQQDHIHQRGLADIQYHYLVGGDGSVYEGRGRKWQGITYPPEVQDADELSGKSIEVAFIKQNMNVKNAENLLQVFSSVIAMGQEEGFLADKIKFYWGTGKDIRYFGEYDPLGNLEKVIAAKGGDVSEEDFMNFDPAKRKV